MSVYFLYAHDRCDRCGKLAAVRAMSLLSDHTLCLSCLASETRVMDALRTIATQLERLEADVRAGRDPSTPNEGRPVLKMPARVAGLADDSPGARLTFGDVRAALRRLRERSALVRIAPGGPAPHRDLPPSS